MRTIRSRYRFQLAIAPARFRGVIQSHALSVAASFLHEDISSLLEKRPIENDSSHTVRVPFI